MKDLAKKILEKLELFNGFVFDSSFSKKECEEILENFIFLLKNKFIDRIILKEVIKDKVNYYLASENKNLEKLKDIKKLSELPNCNLDLLVDCIIEEINKLPIEYEIIFNLPKISEETFYKFDFINNITLILSATQEESLKYDFESYNRLKQKKFHSNQLKEIIKKAMSHINEKIFEKGDSILKIKSSGYVNQFNFYKFVNDKDPVYLFKVLISIYKIFDFFSVRNFFIEKEKVIPPNMINFKKNYNFWIIDNKKKQNFKFELDTKDNEMLISFNFNLKNKENLDLNILNNYLNKLLKIYYYSNNKDNFIVKEIKKLMNAAYWFYEFSTSTIFYNSIIYLVSAFDSIIGSEIKDKLLKSELVSQAIFDNIIQVEHCRIALYALYDLRNQIIHGNKEIKFNMNNYLIELEINFSSNFDKKLVNIFKKNSLNDLLIYCSYFFVKYYKKKFFCFKKYDLK